MGTAAWVVALLALCRTTSATPGRCARRRRGDPRGVRRAPVVRLGADGGARPGRRDLAAPRPPDRHRSLRRHVRHHELGAGRLLVVRRPVRDHARVPHARSRPSVCAVPGHQPGGVGRWRSARQRSPAWPAPATARLWLLVGGGLLAALAADVSGLSSGEVERIWLPFTIWVLPAGAALWTSRRARAGLAGLASGRRHRRSPH